MTASDEGAAPSSSRAADEAIRRMRAATQASESGMDEAPGAAGSVDADVVRTALATLPHGDQQLLWDQHVLERPIETVARESGIHVRAAVRRLRAAEDRLARALTAAHARGAGQQLCMQTRGALHDYVRHHLGPGRRQELEDHLFGCAGCMRAFIDVRHASWALRDTAPLLVGGLAVTGAAGPVVVGAAGAAASSGGLLAWWGTVVAATTAAGEWVLRGLRQVFGRPVGLAAGVGAAALAVAAVAVVGSGADPSPPAAPPSVAEQPAVPPSSAADAAPSVAPSEPGPTDDPTDDPTQPGPTETPESDPAPPPAEDPAGPRPQTVREPDQERDPAADTPSADEPADDPAGDPEPGATAPEQPPTQEPVEPTRPAEPSAPVTSPPPTDPPPTTPTDPPTDPPVEPQPVVDTITLMVGGIGWFRVVPTDGAEIVAVEPVEGYTKAELGWGDHWRVWTANARRGAVDVTVSGEPGSEPGARLVLWDHG
ncbi:hypothetical protein GCM10009718_19420 [Isoptericola halotolerans]|uniref:Putative zinc-finger domain-containing protein n=1 Tax=Isoptericola halotolerans TaxID=300560 RepID=A0ABX2A6I1_9MICO|nr:zf-HC2 domain-containing protein [Isoptericola halotolerans]NOV98474.1 hypothetical protein [Isoptericola halotolerans]